METLPVKCKVSKQTTVYCGLLVLVALAAAGVFISHMDTVEFHGDESGWITSANYYTDLLLRGDFNREAWEGSDLGNWGSVNTHLGQFILGLALRVHPGREVEDKTFAAFYDFTVPTSINAAEGHIPSQGLLIRARTPSVVFAVLSCVLLFVLTYAYTNVWVALIATLLVLGSPVIVPTYVRAMTDVYFNFFLLGVVAASAWFLKTNNLRQPALGAALAGLCCGLACSVKVTGFLLGTLFFLAVLLYKTKVLGLKKFQVAKCLALFLVCSLAVVYALNPYFWPTPREIRIAAVAAEFKELAKEVVTSGITPGKRERYPQLGNLCRVLDFPLLFLRWRQLVDSQVLVEDPGWHGTRLGAIHRVLFIENAVLYLDGFFVCIALVSGVRRLLSSFQEKAVDPWPGPVLYFLLHYAFVVVFVNLNWPRYYAPALVATKIVVAMGVYVAGTYLYVRLKARTGPGKQTQSDMILEETRQE